MTSSDDTVFCYATLHVYIAPEGEALTCYYFLSLAATKYFPYRSSEIRFHVKTEQNCFVVNFVMIPIAERIFSYLYDLISFFQLLSEVCELECDRDAHEAYVLDHHKLLQNLQQKIHWYCRHTSVHCFYPNYYLNYPDVRGGLLEGLRHQVSYPLQQD